LDVDTSSSESSGLITKKQNPQEFEKIVEKEYKIPKTKLDKDRNEWFKQAEVFGIEDAEDESDILSIAGARLNF
jgi:hypothetical protein